MDKRIIVDSSFKEETRVAFINGSEIEHFEVDTYSNKKNTIQYYSSGNFNAYKEAKIERRI